MMRIICLLLITCSLYCVEDVVSAESVESSENEKGTVVEHDRWLNGYLNGQPAMNVHEVVILHQDQTRTMNFNTELMLARSFLGFKSIIKMSQHRMFQENKDGYLTSFHFEDNENGKHAMFIEAEEAREKGWVIR